VKKKRTVNYYLLVVIKRCTFSINCYRRVSRDDNRITIRYNENTGTVNNKKARSAKTKADPARARVLRTFAPRVPDVQNPRAKRLREREKGKNVIVRTPTGLCFRTCFDRGPPYTIRKTFALADPTINPLAERILSVTVFRTDFRNEGVVRDKRTVTITYERKLGRFGPTESISRVTTTSRSCWPRQ